MKNKKGFTLVELLAVIAILAIILLIAVPRVLGVIEESKEKAFRDSILSLFHAVELEYAKTGTQEGSVSSLNLNNNRFLTGTYTIEETGDIILNQVCDGTYKVNIAYNKASNNFEVTKDNGSCGFDILILGKNPDKVSCSSTGSYQDLGAKYKEQLLTSKDTIDLRKAGIYELHYSYEDYTATRVVNVTNNNTPVITLKQDNVTIYQGDTFDPSSYLESAMDECEGDIANKVQSESSVLSDVAGTYTVTYKVKNLGDIETTKTLTVTVTELLLPELVMPRVDGENGWYKTSQMVTVNYDESLDGYEYAISSDNGTTYGEYTSTTETTFPLNINSETIKVKVRGKRGGKYTTPVTSNTIKMDTEAPNVISASAPTSWTTTNKTITVSASDSISGIKGYYVGTSNVKPSESSFVTHENNSYTLAKGMGTYYVFVKDEAGNISEGKSVQVTKITGTQISDYVQNGLQVFYDGKLSNGTNANTNTSSNKGIWKDLSGNNRDGTLQNFSYDNTSGWTTTGLKLGLANDFVAIGEINNSSVTLEAISTFAEVPSKESYHILSNVEGGGYNLYYSMAGYFGLQTYRSNIENYLPLSLKASPNQLNHISGRAENDYQVITMNGRKVMITDDESVKGPIGVTKNNTIMMIGGNPSGTELLSHKFYGTVHMVRIYNRVLSDDEVEKNYVIDKARYQF